MKFPEYIVTPRSYVDEIPVFVDESRYVSAFGLQWLEHSKTQLDSYTGLNITRERITRMFGPILDDLKGKSILEAGCGAGRFTEILLEQEAFITAVDLSIAVIANKENNGGHGNLRIARASITDLPFACGQFDIVFCPGVVQHTPKPEATIKALFDQVKPGGWLVFDQYRHTISSWLKITWVLRIFLKRLSPEMGQKVTDWLVTKWLPIHKKLARKGFLEILLYRISPITAHYSGYLDMSEENQVAWARLNTHDNLTDYHKHFTTTSRITKQLSKLGAVEKYACLMPYTIEVRCQKRYGPEEKYQNEKVMLTKNLGRNVHSG